jgi:uncharacterized protein (TIGR00299 family) protein
VRIAYFDCSAGVAGDMLVASLIDAGASREIPNRVAVALGLGSGVRVVVRRVRRGGFVATGLDIRDRSPAVRGVEEANAAIRGAGFSRAVTRRCLADLRRFASVEANLHGVPVHQVHLHELSAVDTLIDVACFHVMLEALGVDDVQASPINVGGGRFAMSHGTFASPAPATAVSLIDVPVFGQDSGGELTTPTGAALLKGRASRFGRLPAMRLEAVGLGAGSKDMPWPNVVRCFIGSAAAASPVAVETVTLLETNLDDMNPQLYELIIDRLTDAGALDVYLTPIIMKRSRPGTVIGVIAPPSRAAALVEILFRETPTLGVRRTEIQRHALERHAETVETSFGPVQAKVAHLPGGRRRTVAEFADVRRIAEDRGVPVQEVARQVAGELAALDVG